MTYFPAIAMGDWLGRMCVLFEKGNVGCSWRYVLSIVANTRIEKSC